VATLAGKEAVFQVTAKAVGRPVKPAIDDDFAKGFGVDSLSALKERVRSQIGQEYEQVARMKLKRQVLDALDAAHTFALPPTLVDNEFEAIWRQVTESLKRANKSFEDEGKTEEGARAEYRKIAKRRVRLGLILGEVGSKGKIEVTQDELRAALFNQARRFPGQERAVYEYYEKTPGALMELRAPIFEDKTIDYIVGQANPTERKVPREELLKPLEGDEADAHLHHGEHAHHHHHDHDHDHHDHDLHHHGADHDHHHERAPETGPGAAKQT
jgi:trigger factor